MSFVPGDVQVHQLLIGSVDMKYNFVCFDVYESIYTPGIVANITVLDTEDFIGRMKLSGGEQVVIVFQAPGLKTATYNLVINKISNQSAAPSQHAKSYVVEAVSPEVLNSKAMYIIKKYQNKTYSEMAQDVFKNVSGKSLNIETTKGVHKYAVQNEKPFAAIDAIRRRSVSATNQTSSYLFFENQYGFHYKTLEQLFKDNVVLKTIKQNAATGSNMSTASHDNILSYVGRQAINAGSVVGAGSQGAAYGVFNMFTMAFKQTSVDNPLGSATAGGSLSSLTKNFGQMGAGLKHFLPASNEKETGLGGKSGIPEASTQQTAYAAAVSSTAMSVATIGDAVFTVGGMVNLQIIAKMDTTGPKGLEYGLSDRMLIANVRHQIKPPGSRPRYVTVLECIKGGLEGA